MQFADFEKPGAAHASETTSPDLEFLAGGGTTGALMRALDWSASPLGPPQHWPQSLRSVVGLMLHSRFAMFVAWGRDLGLLYNDPYSEILGGKHPRALGGRFRDIWSEIWDDISPSIETALAGQASYHEDLPLLMNRHGYDEQTWFTFSYSPVRDERGRVAGMFCSCIETTSKVLAERGLRQSERRLQALVMASNDVMYRMNRDWSHMLSLEGHGFIEDTPDLNANWMTRYIHPEDQPGVTAAIHEAIGRKSVFELEHRVRRADGTLGWTHSRAVPILDAAGEVVEWFGTASDVTVRKSAEAALREEAQALETLNDIGKALAGELDLQRTVQAVTDAATRVCRAQFGAFFYNVIDPRGESYTLFTLSGAPREAFEKFGMPRNTAVFGPTFNGEGVVRVDDITRDPCYGRNAPHQGMPRGHLPVSSYLAVPVISRSGEVIGGLFFGHPQPAMFTGRDERLVTAIASQAAAAIDNARLYQQRLELIEQLREEDRRKDEFIATLSHELRNPLAPLRNSLHFLRQSGKESAEAAPVHAMMERQVNYLVRLVDDLLEISRISRGAFELRKERVEVAAVVKSALETSDPLIKAGGHRLDVSLPEEPMWLDGDLVRLAQVLANLLNNAAKYTGFGGLITVAARREGGQAILTVRDNGVGIAPETLPRIFDMFSRGDHAGTADVGGLGIGLALARRLAQMHQGTITAASAGTGTGSEFTVRLPLAEASQVPAAAEGAVLRKVRRVLVVDDNHDAADSLSLVVSMLGAEVKVAHSGPEALRINAEFRPAVVLLDIGMPGMDGYEVAQRIRADHPAASPVLVALTGWGQEEDRRRAQDAGFDHHIIKPADFAVLEKLLTGIDAASGGT